MEYRGAKLADKAKSARAFSSGALGHRFTPSEVDRTSKQAIGCGTVLFLGGRMDLVEACPPRVRGSLYRALSGERTRKEGMGPRATLTEFGIKRDQGRTRRFVGAAGAELGLTLAPMSVPSLPAFF